MPPQTRGSKTTKAKENIGVISKAKSKANGKVTKQRKALADKTNSTSDNSSSEIRKKVVSAPPVQSQVVEIFTENKVRPRRERKLPNRFNENKLLVNLSNNKESDSSVTEHDKNKKLDQNDSTISTQFKTPQKGADSSLIANRPKRVCRLPSKFDDHSVSPNKFIPVGCHASTPIVPNKITTKIPGIQVKGVLENKDTVVITKTIKQNKLTTKKSPLKRSVELPTSQPSSDTNNNAKRRILRDKTVESKAKPQKSPEIVPLSKEKTAGEKLLEKSFSFRVLEDKKKSTKRDNSHLDVYEFTFDPNEEPPQKKKRKKAVRKKPAKPKTVVFKSNYDQNVGKALAALKKAVSNKPTVQQAQNPVANKDNNTIKEKPAVTATVTTTNPSVTQITKPPLVTITSNDLSKIEIPPQQPKIASSTRVEDIAADFEPLMDHNDIDYSPVSTPNRGKSPVTNGTIDNTLRRPLHVNDPLNLQDNLSFFDDVPVASSSMNTSVRRPHDSPWRIQFEQLPIKWHANTYVKANMTPAVESSFINSEETNKKRHVYTNLVSETNEVLPDIFENQSNLKQTSMMSFIKEVVERSASKKKRKAMMVTPTKANSIFDDVSNMSVRDVYRTPKKTPRKDAVDNNRTPNKGGDENLLTNAVNIVDKQNSGNNGKNYDKNTDKSSPNKEKDGTYFGFDESEDQENVSPVKIDNPRVRALRPRARAVLQEINSQSGPTRAKVPVAAKTKIAMSSDAINKVYDGMKSASDAPVFPENNANNEDLAITQVEDQFDPEDDDSQSVHLFEDIEIVHHLKPSRKSYGKARKVTFQQTTASDSDSQSNGARQLCFESSDEDDLADLSFTMPKVAQKNGQKKRANKKKQLSKKEKAEMEAWAAQFNSMCEDVEEFPLVVE